MKGQIKGARVEQSVHGCKANILDRLLDTVKGPR